MPADLAAALAESARWHRLRAQWMLLELGQILPVLEAVGAQPVVLKGAALAQTFGAARTFSDLDVLVAASALERATGCLAGLGYEGGQTARANLFYERYHFHRVLRSKTNLTLELHWDLTRPNDYFHLRPEEITARALSLPFGAAIMRVPCHSDQLLHAAAQSLREGFTTARRVLDTAVLLRAGAGSDPHLAERAEAGGLGTALWALLHISGEITGLAAPPLQGALRPSTIRRASLETLDLTRLLLERRSAHLPGLKSWLSLLCAPSARVTLRTLGRTIFPGERGLLDDGHRPETLPGFPYRTLLSVKRLGQTARLAAYQAWRLGRPRRTQAGGRTR